MIGATLWFWVVVTSATALLPIAAFVWRQRRDNPGSRSFLVVVLASAAYAFGYAGQLAATTLAGKLLWFKLQYLGLAVIPVALVVFALEYAGRSELVSVRSVALLSVVPSVTAVSVWLEPGIGLFLVDPHLVPVHGVFDLTYGHGPLGLLGWGYQYLCFLVAALVFLNLTVHSTPAYRVQGWVLLAGISAPALAGGLSLASSAIYVDLAPPTFLFTAGVVTWGIYHSDVLDVVPIDRASALEGIDGAVFVLDADGCVVDANRRARALLDRFALGASLEDLFAESGIGASLDELSDGDAVTVDRDAERRFEVGRDEISTRFGDRRGDLLTLYDVTDRWKAEQRLERRSEQLAVLNRLLRHDIRNDAAIVSGWSEELRDRLDDPDDREVADRIADSARHIVRLTEDASTVAETFTGDAPDLEPVALGPVLDESVGTIDRRYPEAAVETPDEWPSVAVRANDLLDSVFVNLLDNAVQHNDRDAPTVVVDVAVESGRARVTVADTGPGIPSARRAAVRERAVSGASGGLGLGLYLVDRLVEAFGGSFDLRVNEPRGTRAVVDLPVAE